MPRSPALPGSGGVRIYAREYHQAVKGLALCKNERARGLMHRV